MEFIFHISLGILTMLIKNSNIIQRTFFQVSFPKIMTPTEEERNMVLAMNLNSMHLIF